ncbi:Rieske 2Fe-2S domain-containing protein [Kribbella sp. NPDC055071]
MVKSSEAMDRRTILAAGSAIAGAAILSGCVVEQSAPPTASTQPQATGAASAPTSPDAPAGTQSAPASEPAQPPLAKVSDIPAGGGVILSQQRVVLTKDQSGKVAAFSAICTHQGCTVTEVRDGTINCPCHKSKFDAGSGQPVSGPAKKPLPPVSIQQRGDGVFKA